MMAPQPVSMSTTWVQRLAQPVGPVPGALFTIGLPLLIWFGLRFVPFRRYLYAVGSNDATAFSSGVNVAMVRVGSYALGGLFAGCGGIALTALVSTADASQSTEYTFVAIAAVALGGISLSRRQGGPRRRIVRRTFGDLSLAGLAFHPPDRPGLPPDHLWRNACCCSGSWWHRVAQSNRMGATGPSSSSSTGTPSCERPPMTIGR